VPHRHDAGKLAGQRGLDDRVPREQLEPLGAGCRHPPALVGGDVEGHVDRLLDRDEQAHGQRVLAIGVLAQ
jgi:hypothetical protein